MTFKRHMPVAIVTASLAFAAVVPAQAGDQYSFPSASGAMIASTPSKFAAPAAPQSASQVQSPGLDGAVTLNAASKGVATLPSNAFTRTRFDTRSPSNDAYAYHFLTNALSSQSISNYAADYYRLFTPGYAVTAWTDRVAGVVETGYGNTIDSWTAGAYYLARVRGPSVRRDSPPDLNLMPELRAHPELQTNPTFGKGN